jgi:hypothetical protein
MLLPPTPRRLPPSATSHCPSPAPCLRAPHSSPSLSPDAHPFFPSGRSKAQRWEDSTPSPPRSLAAASRSSPSPRPSYRDVVISQPTPKPSLPIPPGSRPVLRSEVGFYHLSTKRPDHEGWCLVQCRFPRLSKAPHSRWQVLEDLRGHCFNCLSTSHRAVACHRPTRCFCCLEPSHHSSHCLHWLAAPRPRGHAWRPVNAAYMPPLKVAAAVDEDRRDRPCRRP